ncbi:MAG: type II/IV secretion system protein [Candidatus Saganbacteria bacterium]|nr:type II/IV secretion system protein [Candidatus Saganbacteria bacterium]
MNAPALLDELINEAAQKRASDIHLEPQADHLRVRLRIDGRLTGSRQLPKHLQALLISRIKVMVGLDIAENRLPQDGRVTAQALDLRVSCLPSLHGEKVVIRLLNKQQTKLDLKDLGMELDDLETYLAMIERRCGLILVTGPTGSGKTTTLYATLAKLNDKDVNITTIEDPIEYQLPGINQVQVNLKAGLTFARGLRAILRQDPDIIMVGEIRDEPSARIAVQAALTGHLVLSTLHTNDAPSAVTRLVDMGIEKYLVEASLIGVLAQRLIRKKGPAGLLGRTGIYEVMFNNKRARSLAENGRRKIEQNLTTETEVRRVLYLDD